MRGAPIGVQAPSDPGKLIEGDANPFFCKSACPMPDPWREPNASDDLIGMHPDRVAFMKQQEQHFISRARLASLRPRGIYGPGLLSNTLPHQTKFFCLHQPLPPLPIPEAHKYHRFALVDLLEHDSTDRGDQTGNEPGFFCSLVTAGGGDGNGNSTSSTVSPEKSAKTVAATIASFLLSAAPGAALGPHAFRKVAMQQPPHSEQPVAASGSALLRSLSAQSLRQQQQPQHSGSSIVGTGSSVSTRLGRGSTASYVSISSQRQLLQQQQYGQQRKQYVQQQQYMHQQQLQQQQQGTWGTATETKHERKRKTKRRKLDG